MSFQDVSNPFFFGRSADQEEELLDKIYQALDGLIGNSLSTNVMNPTQIPGPFLHGPYSTRKAELLDKILQASLKLTGGGEAQPGSFLKIYTATNGNGFLLPAGTIIERITVTDPNNNPNTIRLFMEGFPEILLSELNLESNNAIDQIDYFINTNRTFYFTGFTASTVASIRYYQHPNF